MPVRSETSAVRMVTPALGPSFGMAPAGKWMWTSVFSRKLEAMPSVSDFERRYDRAACADSFMTSPSWPVRVSDPLPAILVASMKRMSPPAAVQASPVATPAISVRSAVSL